MHDERPEVQELIRNLKGSLQVLKKLLEECNGEWVYEDYLYRLYHQSFKVYGLQGWTRKIVEALQALVPNRPLNKWFVQIVADGTHKAFRLEDNQRWLKVTRPIVEAFFHARYFLEMAVRYGDLAEAPTLLPSGWAALLYLYDLR